MRTSSPALGLPQAERAGMFEARTVTDDNGSGLPSVVNALPPSYPELPRSGRAKAVLAAFAVLAIVFSTLVVRPGLLDSLCNGWAGAASVRGVRDAARAIHDAL